MHLADLIGPEAVILSLKVKNKKQLLQELSARAARLTGLQERYIFDTLLQRERLGNGHCGRHHRGGNQDDRPPGPLSDAIPPVECHAGDPIP